MGNKHVGPKIGQIVQNKQALLQNVYSRGIWSRSPDHHLVFTYQAMPRSSTGRKRMKYLNEGGMFGDTAFNSWPVPMVPIANMPKTTLPVHDDIFENDPAADSGAEDGTGSAVVQDLGEKVIPFPREMSEMFTREMIHVFDIDVGIFLTPASGKALMAIILENRRAVAIVKNKAHREFIMQQLIENVRNLNLAADTRPAKPQELTAWESANVTTGKPKAPAPQVLGAPLLMGTSIPADPAIPSPPEDARGGAGFPPPAGVSPMMPPPRLSTALAPDLPPVAGSVTGSSATGPGAAGSAAPGLAGFGSSLLR